MIARRLRLLRYRKQRCPETEKDQTLRAMHDEMERARTRLQIEGVDKPYYVEYRLLDLDVKTITSSFGSLIASNTNRNRFMSIDVRIGDYHLDSSNFISEDGFQGFLGTTGEVGIDHDYNSLRQDLWLSTDQAYKQAATQMSLKQAFLRSLTKPPEIDDFSQAAPLVQVDPRPEVNWTTRSWEDEARAASAVLKNYPELNGTRVNYYMAYVTYYLMNTEGTTIRTSRTIGAVEAGDGYAGRRRPAAAQFLFVVCGEPAGHADARGAGEIDREGWRRISGAAQGAGFAGLHGAGVVRRTRSGIAAGAGRCRRHCLARGRRFRCYRRSTK